MSAHAETIRATRPPVPVYAYWHLLSLDAPTVAVVWCCAFAASAGIRLTIYTPVALGTATWMLYVGDRLLDLRNPHEAGMLRERHWFHGRHVTVLLAGLAIAAILLTWIVATVLPGSVLRPELLLGAVVLLYFAAIHFPARGLVPLYKIPSKEVIVGVIFSLAVAIPAWGRAPHQLDLLISVLGFAALCALNCVAIESIEQPSPKRISSARLCGNLLLLLAAGSLVLAGTRWADRQQLLLLSISSSALLLFLLCRLSSRMSGLAFRVAADAVLLTPILFAPWLWMHR